MTTATPTLTVADITVTTDSMGRPYVIVPDDVARLLRTASLAGIDPEARGIHFESTPHPADSWVATTVRTVFNAVLASPVADEDHHAHGLWQYRKWDGGTFYGWIIGESAWNADTRWWRDHRQHTDLISRGATIASKDRGRLAGTCTFVS